MIDVIFVWIIIGAVLLAVAVYGFWPHRSGLVDNEIRLAKRRDAGRRDYYGG
jgi:hypothetical protein